MIINDKEIVTIFYEVYQRYFYNEDIHLENVNFIIGDSMKLYVQLLYKNTHTTMNVISDIQINNQYIIIKPKGIVKYGFLQFDLLTLLKEYQNNYFIIKEEQLLIPNHFIKSLQYYNGTLEILLKQS
ncbi:hypothetical protein [Tannockella kyphosi]|uniref:hypothetical protein n=1 Tax=Tannockella kyphosi TaxID=2899121 RepID=UPI002010F2DE|nr:hypothetical protein [Tannockella kyphosi]